MSALSSSIARTADRIWIQASSRERIEWQIRGPNSPNGSAAWEQPVLGVQVLPPRDAERINQVGRPHLLDDEVCVPHVSADRAGEPGAIDLI